MATSPNPFSMPAQETASMGGMGSQHDSAEQQPGRRRTYFDYLDGETPGQTPRNTSPRRTPPRSPRARSMGANAEQEEDAYVPTFSYSYVVDENFHDVTFQPHVIQTIAEPRKRCIHHSDV